MINKRIKALVVDDEDSVRALLERILHEAGYEVITAANGKQALDKIAACGTDLVVLDNKMPGMTGLEVLRQVMAKWPQTCVVMATAYAETQTAVEAMKLGAYDYIIKPFSRGAVLTLLSEAIAKRNAQLEKDSHMHELENKVVVQTQQLQQQFVDLVATLSREHKLIHELANRRGNGAELISSLPKELQTPMNSIEEFGEALIKILRQEITHGAGRE